MVEIIRMNKQLPEDVRDLNEAIEDLSELNERDELVCTGYACGADVGFM